MMEKILLLVLVFSEIFILSHCLIIRQYHLVNKSVNWTEAQTYCRKNYIDLATIENSEELEIFLKTVNNSNSYQTFWIGLHNEINWRWSDGFKGGINTDNYSTSEDQYHSRSDQICLTTGNTKQASLSDFNCSSLFTFICYNGTRQNPKYVFVNERLNWSSAQTYCRQNFTDLATVRNETDWQMIYNNELSNGQNSWIGLYRDSNISWSDGSSFFNNKIRFPLLLWPNNAKCGSYYKLQNDRWRFVSCTYAYVFVCYSFQPVKKLSVKIRLKTSGPVNLNDPTVKAVLLEKFQKNLTDIGVSGVELKWKEHSDGNVFIKEEKKKSEI